MNKNNMYKFIIINNKKFELMVANSFVTRIIGLLKFNKIRDNQAMLISPCNSIHTIGMRFSINVIFIDENNKVTKYVKGVKPFNLSMSINNNTKNVIEISYIGNENLKVNIGDIINYE